MKMPAVSDEATPDLVTIRTFASESEAMIAKSALDAFGIDCTLGSDDCGGQRPSLAMSNGIRLVVRAGDAGRAEDVLSNVAEDPI
jgi:hypothetical protein